MLNVNANGTVQLTRGDSAWFSVSINDKNTNELYELAPDDVLVLTIKKRYSDQTACIQKISTGSNLFYIEPEDTQSLDFGKYIYDVQLTTEDGYVTTVIPPTTFELTREVTY